MSILDDGSNGSLLAAALLGFITGAAVFAARALRRFEPNAELPDTDDETTQMSTRGGWQ